MTDAAAGPRPGRSSRYQARGALAWTRGAALLVALSAAGCDGCERSHPYTPYRLEDPAAPSGSPAPDAGALTDGGGDAGDAGPDAAAAFVPIPGAAAPGAGKSWTLGEGSIAEAPPGRRFEVGHVVDGNGDGKLDLFAWAKAPDGLRGELWFAPGAKPEDAQTIAAMPPDLAARGCTTSAALAQVGPRTLALDLSVRCPDRDGGRAKRWIALVRLVAAGGPPAGGSAVPELRLELTAAPPPLDESLGVSIDATDRDGDGRDDVTATVTLSGAARPFKAGVPASAIVRFFDRPAGLSRDPSEPEASLRARGDALVADARKKSAAGGVAANALTLERLWKLLCEEGGAPLLTTSAGAIRCGDARPLEEATFARGLAALTLGDPPLAMAEKTRLAVVALETSPRRKELEKLVDKQIPRVTAAVKARAQAVPSGDGAAGAPLSPLAFEHKGHLLVRTDEGVVRVDEKTFAEEPSDVPPWPGAFATRPAEGQAGQALRAVVQRCDEASLSAEIAPSAGDPLASPTVVLLPLLSPVDARGFPALRCDGLPRVSVVPLDAGPSTLVIAIGGRPVTLDLGARPSASATRLPAAGLDRPLGSARSPDGSTLALPTPGGVLVATGTSAKLWTGADIDKAWGCTPSNGGKRLACVASGAAVVFEGE